MNRTQYKGETVSRIVTNKSRATNAVRRLRNHGILAAWDYERPGQPGLYVLWAPVTKHGAEWTREVLEQFYSES
jgi:hypothetical protein